LAKGAIQLAQKVEEKSTFGALATKMKGGKANKKR